MSPAKKPDPPPVEVTSHVRSTFLGHFYAERSRFADTPSSLIRSAGQATKAKPNGEDELWWMANGPEMLQRWEDWRDSSDWKLWVTPDGVPAVELEIFEDFDGVNIKMFIDRVFETSTGALVIVDLKSGARTPASDLQLGVYAAGILKKFGIAVYGGCYWMARDGEMTDIVPLGIYTPELVGHYAHQFQFARKSGVFPPHVTAMCRACGVRDYCVAAKGKKMFLDPDYRYVSGLVDPEQVEEEEKVNDCNS